MNEIVCSFSYFTFATMLYVIGPNEVAVYKADEQFTMYEDTEYITLWCSDLEHPSYDIYMMPGKLRIIPITSPLFKSGFE